MHQSCFSLAINSSDHARVTTCHRVFTIRAKRNQFGTPMRVHGRLGFCTHAGDVLSGVSIVKSDDHKVHVVEYTTRT